MDDLNLPKPGPSSGKLVEPKTNNFSDDKENLGLIQQEQNLLSPNSLKRKFPINDETVNNKLSKFSEILDSNRCMDATFANPSRTNRLLLESHQSGANHTVTSGDFERSLHDVIELPHNDTFVVTPRPDSPFATSVIKTNFRPNPIAPRVPCHLKQEPNDVGVRKNDSQATSKSNEDTFNELINIFPDIDHIFLREQCSLNLNIEQVADVIVQLNGTYPKHEESHTPSQPSPLLPLGLESNDLKPSGDHDRPTENSKCEEKETKKDDSTQLPNNSGLNFLIQIFPDADPSFLASKAKLCEQELDTFITHALENKDYPKIISKREEDDDDGSSEIDLYTGAKEFNIETFINIFPEPFDYFLDDNRVCNESLHAVEFLKKRYRNQAIKMILMKYRECKHNLTKTCDLLDNMKQSRATKRNTNEIHMPKTIDLQFLKEVCFIEHRKEIQKYIDDKKETKRLSFELAQAQGNLIECGCCYQEVMFEDCLTCNEGDLFCKDCVKKSTEVRIGDGLTTFPCLQDCESEFSLNSLQGLLDARVFSRLLVRIQSDEVRAANIEGLEVCPFCEYAAIPPPEDKIFFCKNPDCLKESCRKCFKVNHIPLRCEEVETDDQAMARKYIEDEMTRALVRECYKCKKNFIKLDGCNKMTCTCGAKMCYICRQPIVDYQHFNGPGGSAAQKCPLYSSEKVLNVDMVKAVAEKALEKVKADNPDLELKHDPSKVLPADPKQNALPPGVVEQPREIIANMIQHLQGHGPRPVAVPQQQNAAQAIPPPPPPPPFIIDAFRPVAQFLPPMLEDLPPMLEDLPPMLEALQHRLPQFRLPVLQLPAMMEDLLGPPPPAHRPAVLDTPVLIPPPDVGALPRALPAHGALPNVAVRRGTIGGRGNGNPQRGRGHRGTLDNRPPWRNH